MKAHLVPLGNRLAILGLVALALSVTGVVVLITDVLYGALTTVIIGGACGLLFAVLWFALPISARIEEE